MPLVQTRSQPHLRLFIAFLLTPGAFFFSPSQIDSRQRVGSISGQSLILAAVMSPNDALNNTLPITSNDETTVLPWNNKIATKEIAGLESLSSSSPVIPKYNLLSLPNINAAVIVPGFLTGKDHFASLAKSLTDMGIPTVVVPMPNWHWLPCLGGRSMRPILERIDFTVRHLAGVAGDLQDYDRITGSVSGVRLQKSLDNALLKKSHSDVTLQKDDPQILIPEFDYDAFDCCQDMFHNPGEPSRRQQVWTPKGSFPTAPEPMGKVALIGHSAGGWIARAYLSQRKYYGKSYAGQNLVHSLITLGSPHFTAPSPAFKGVEWVNGEVMDSSSGVRALAVGGAGYKGDSSGELTRHSYAFCCPMRSDGSQYDGDGVTPTLSSLAMKKYAPHADTMILDNVGHFSWSDIVPWSHQEGRPWYGDEEIVEKWAGWL